MPSRSTSAEPEYQCREEVHKREGHCRLNREGHCRLDWCPRRKSARRNQPSTRVGKHKSGQAKQQREDQRGADANQPAENQPAENVPLEKQTDAKGKRQRLTWDTTQGGRSSEERD